MWHWHASKMHKKSPATCGIGSLGVRIWKLRGADLEASGADWEAFLYTPFHSSEILVHMPEAVGRPVLFVLEEAVHVRLGSASAGLETTEVYRFRVIGFMHL